MTHPTLDFLVHDPFYGEGLLSGDLTDAEAERAFETAYRMSSIATNRTLAKLDFMRGRLLGRTTYDVNIKAKSIPWATAPFSSEALVAFVGTPVRDGRLLLTLVTPKNSRNVTVASVHLIRDDAKVFHLRENQVNLNIEE